MKKLKATALLCIYIPFVMAGMVFFVQKASIHHGFLFVLVGFTALLVIVELVTKFLEGLL